jgi:hypothetical protein
MSSLVIDTLPNTMRAAGTISAFHDQSNLQQSAFVSEWYLVTTPEPTAAITSLANRVDAEIFEASQRLSHHYAPCEEELISPKFDFFDEPPVVHFPPTKVSTFTLEVISKSQGRVEAIFAFDDTEYLIDDSDV